MRTTVYAVILFLAASFSASSGESMRINLVKGIYSVNVPANWYVDIDASDSTLSIAQGPEPSSPRIVIAVPNPEMADHLDQYARMAADSFMRALGGGQIVEDKAERDNHGVIFRSSAPGADFLGAIQTRRHDGYAVLTVFLTRESDYPRSKDWAAAILNSLRVNDTALERETAFIGRQAASLLRDFRQFEGRPADRADPDETALDWNAPDDGGLINNPFSALTR